MRVFSLRVNKTYKIIMNKNLKNQNIIISPEMVKIDGNIAFADKITKAKETLAKTGFSNVEKIEKYHKELKK
jgi:hypothetical protein